MSEIELVLTDIDGTLVIAGQRTPSEAVCQAIKDVKEKGVTVTAATGRPHEMMQPIFLELGLDGPYVCDGGASVRDVESGRLLWQNWLAPERLREIGSIILPHCTTVDLFPGFVEISPKRHPMYLHL